MGSIILHWGGPGHRRLFTFNLPDIIEKLVSSVNTTTNAPDIIERLEFLTLKKRIKY